MIMNYLEKNRKKKRKKNIFNLLLWHYLHNALTLTLIEGKDFHLSTKRSFDFAKWGIWVATKKKLIAIQLGTFEKIGIEGFVRLLETVPCVITSNQKVIGSKTQV